MLDGNLIRKIAAGDYPAFRSLYEAMSERLYYYACKLSGDSVAAEDLVQETFIFYWEHRADFADPIAVKVYLFTTLRYITSNYVRVTGNRRRIVDNLPPAEAADHEHSLISAEVGAVIRQAIRELPPQTGRVISMSMADCSVEMTARELDISPNTVKALRKSGYKILRKKLSGVRSLLPLLLS